jgi:hypothetical protein
VTGLPFGIPRIVTVFEVFVPGNTSYKSSKTNSVPKKAIKSEMLLLRECMMSIEVDVPLLSDGEIGPRLGSLEDLKEPKPDLSRWTSV